MSAAVPRDDDTGPGLEPEPVPAPASAPAPVLRDAATGTARAKPNGAAATRSSARANAGGPPASLSALMDALRCLPGVGPKAAQRMAYHLLQYDRSGAETLAGALGNALQTVVRCARCNTFTETEVCGVCASPRRDPALLCVVETPSDLLMMEQTLAYNGMYFVLMGRLSPLDGIGPRDIGLDVLARRATDGTVREVVVATNFTNEGEATAHYIGEMLRDRGVKVSRIARGIPVGGELEYVDIGTIAQAMVERRPV